MNIKKILKLIGYLVGPIVPLVVAIYLLFPYLNEEQHQKVSEKYKYNFSQVDSTSIDLVPRDYQTLKERADDFLSTIDKLNMQIDSIEAINDSLAQELMAKRENKDESQNSASNIEPEKKSVLIQTEKFTESVGSLLGLNDEELSPILDEMSDEQLIRLFETGNSLQKRKLLRSLESKRAANLMSEVMQ